MSLISINLFLDTPNPTVTEKNEKKQKNKKNLRRCGEEISNKIDVKGKEKNNMIEKKIRGPFQEL